VLKQRICSDFLPGLSEIIEGEELLQRQLTVEVKQLPVSFPVRPWATWTSG